MIAAIYARKSPVQNGVAEVTTSVTRQVEHARAYAGRKGWTVADDQIYLDDRISGAEFENRPGYMRLMNALKPRAPFEVLIVSELSRLGREQFETNYALKQLSLAGVRVYSHLEDREVLLDTPTDKFLMSAVSFAAEMERDKARQRTYDAMLCKARAGHVTGGRVFGYDNVRAAGGPVTRAINEAEAAVVRDIFALYGRGHGLRLIAHQLNKAGARCPRAQQGRPNGWAPSSVREVLYRPLYRGEIVWNRTQKRNRWGQVNQQNRPEADWLTRPAPELRVVPEALAKAVDARLTSNKTRYLRTTGGRLWGRPSGGPRASICSSDSPPAAPVGEGSLFGAGSMAAVEPSTTSVPRITREARRCVRTGTMCRWSRQMRCCWRLCDRRSSRLRSSRRRWRGRLRGSLP